MKDGNRMKIKFLGGAGTVTGSKYLLSINDKKILIDCGLFQGVKNLREKNWQEFPINISTIDAVILTIAAIFLRSPKQVIPVLYIVAGRLWIYAKSFSPTQDIFKKKMRVMPTTKSFPSTTLPYLSILKKMPASL